MASYGFGETSELEALHQETKSRRPGKYIAIASAAHTHVSQPMLPHSLLLGHLPFVTKLMGQLPKDAHAAYLPSEIQRTYPELGPNYYVDLMPFAPSMLVIGSPEAHYQIAQEHSLPKLPNLRNFVRPLTDGLDMLTMEGAEWKQWRGVFNPGFSHGHMMTLVPAIVKETQSFCRNLDKHVKSQDIFAMKSLTDYLTLDIIGQVVLGVHFDCQRKPSPVMESLRTQIRWFSFGVEPNLFDRYNPVRPLVQWYHSRIVNAYISSQFDERVAMHRTHDGSDVRRTRTIIDLALTAYKNDVSTTKSAAIDPFFKRVCMSQIKLFLFSGHDTTSAAICYHLYLLAQHPKVLARVRKEHDSVFGTDTASTASIISAAPHLLSQLPLTTAVIKESLRLFSTVTPSRQGERGFSIKDDQGRAFPTGDFLVLPDSQSIHKSPAYWPEPESFIPDRFLVAPDDPLCPVKGAWRGFEWGPRNCIGQELAMLEMKAALALVSRSYDFTPAYEELDKKAGRKQVTLHGERAYQVDILQPRGNLPMRVNARGR